MKFPIVALLAIPTSYGFVSHSSRASLARRIDSQLFADQDDLEKANAEIQALKAEITQMQSNGGALANIGASSMDLSQMTKEELANKVLQYQQFMAKYIIDEQKRKAEAVKAAENALRAIYEQKLRALGGSADIVPASSEDTNLYNQRTAKVAAAGAVGKSRWGEMETAKAAGVSPIEMGTVNGAVASPTPAIVSTDSSLYVQRNARVAAAGQAGKSRWGEMEIQKAAKGVASLPAASVSSDSIAPTAAASPATGSLYEQRSAMVAAAGLAGKSRWGEMEIKKAQIMTAALPAASKSSASPPATIASKDASLYDKRNFRVAAAGKAGKSRWGEMEILKAATFAASLPSGSAISSPAPSSATTLPARINIGAQLVSQGTASFSVYDKRNARVAAAGKAGKSRWGEMEIHKAATLAASLPSGPAAPSSTSTVLPARINIGAQLVNKGTSEAKPANGSLYVKRSAAVAAAGMAGKSRWGEMEIKKAQSTAAALPASV